MSNNNLYSWNNFSLPNDPEEMRRDELCLQLAENLYDLGACEFSLELRAGDSKFIIRVTRC